MSIFIVGPKTIKRVCDAGDVAVAARRMRLGLSEGLKPSYSRQKLRSSLIESGDLSNENSRLNPSI
jgi:hypothetical protein